MNWRELKSVVHFVLPGMETTQKLRQVHKELCQEFDRDERCIFARSYLLARIELSMAAM